mmetsp:Transcript_76905/g.152216  ORF Transcript_76905/g.152216 Transcript_76905/m.152216 type:complete len:121 (+) Transcript_76905:63-425(+)
MHHLRNMPKQLLTAYAVAAAMYAAIALLMSLAQQQLLRQFQKQQQLRNYAASLSTEMQLSRQCGGWFHRLAPTRLQSAMPEAVICFRSGCSACGCLLLSVASVPLAAALCHCCRRQRWQC